MDEVEDLAIELYGSMKEAQDVYNKVTDLRDEAFIERHGELCKADPVIKIKKLKKAKQEILLEDLDAEIKKLQNKYWLMLANIKGLSMEIRTRRKELFEEMKHEEQHL